MNAENLVIIPPVTHMEQYERDYAFMRANMIYRESPDFEFLIKELNQLTDNFRNWF